MNNKKKIAVLSGAGISAESGLATFRDSGGLWEGFDVMEVASIEGWYQDKSKVLDFYNMRRKQAFRAEPNAGHFALSKLEYKFDVSIITQNVDNLHEKAGSRNVIHLHGKLSEAKSSIDDNLVYDIGDREIRIGDLCEKKSQLRPNIVWFGEQVPLMYEASKIIQKVEALIIVGTSLQVYPAAGLIDYASLSTIIILVDPNPPSNYQNRKNLICIAEKATTGLDQVEEILTEKLLGQGNF